MLTFQGSVERGEGLACQLGCPTANLTVGEGAIIPGLGIYLAQTAMEGVWHPSLVCVSDGKNGHVLKLEVHVLDQDLSLLGKKLTVRLLQKIRDFIPWTDVEPEYMKEMIQKDLQFAHDWFAQFARKQVHLDKTSSFSSAKA